jgi:hypothetical protein
MPASQRKIDAARANGAKSTGPKTRRGKTASALNAVTHGLTAQTVVLSNESRDEFQAELNQYLAHFQPQTKPEWDLVHQLAAARWRLGRYAAVETGIWNTKWIKTRPGSMNTTPAPPAHTVWLSHSSTCPAQILPSLC